EQIEPHLAAEALAGAGPECGAACITPELNAAIRVNSIGVESACDVVGVDDVGSLRGDDCERPEWQAAASVGLLVGRKILRRVADPKEHTLAENGHRSITLGYLLETSLGDLYQRAVQSDREEVSLVNHLCADIAAEHDIMAPALDRQGIVI